MSVDPYLDSMNAAFCEFWGPYYKTDFAVTQLL